MKGGRDSPEEYMLKDLYGKSNLIARLQDENRKLKEEIKELEKALSNE